MNPEQRSAGPVPVHADPDSSQPEAEPGQRTLSGALLGNAAVATRGAEVMRRQQHKTDRRFARPVHGQLAGSVGNLRRADDHGWRLAS